MRFDVFFVALVITAALFLYWVSYKTRKEIKRMAGMPPKKDILLKISRPVPYLWAILFLSPFGLIEYYIIDPSFKYVSIFAGLILTFIFVLVYWLIRASKNRLNNKYLEMCAERNVGFVPGNLYTNPIVKDQPWSLKDQKKVIFTRNDLSKDNIILVSGKFKQNPKDHFKSCAVIIGVILICYVLWFLSDLAFN